jgi:hypothetical protein
VQLRISLTSAFLTDVPLRLALADYRTKQARVGEALAARAGEGWAYDPLGRASAAGSFSVGGGYASLTPVVFVTRSGPQITTRLREAGRSTSWDRPGRSSDIDLDLASARIQLFDFGVGAIEAIYDLVAPAQTTPAQVIEHVNAETALDVGVGQDRGESLGGALASVVEETTRAFTDTVRATVPEAIEKPWLEAMYRTSGVEGHRPGTKSRTDDEHESPNEAGKLLWIHRFYMLRGHADADAVDLERLGLPFRSSFSTTVNDWDDIFIPGIDSSVLVSREEPPTPESFVPSMMLLHTGYLALLIETDRGLLATLGEVEEWDSARHLSHLEREAQQVFQLQMRAEKALARLDSILIDFGGGGLALWGAVARVQRFDDIVRAIDSKIKILQRLTQRRVQEASSVRERTTNNILGFLTALTIVGLAVGLADGFFGERPDRAGHVAVRIGAILVSLILAGQLFRRVRWRAPNDSRRGTAGLRRVIAIARRRESG